MNIKRVVIMLLLAGLMCMPALARAEDGGESGESGGMLDFSKLRQGDEISDAFVDEDEPQPIPPDQIKAVGYEYDRDALIYDLVFEDEFEGEGAPDPEKWGYDIGGGGFGNNELQYYTDSGNAFLEDGCLVIEARKQEMGLRDYTSARLVSRQKADFLYGKFEIRAKLPSGRGTWPAIWMLPTDWAYGAWPASGEIDIMEHVGYDQDYVHCTIHTEAYNHMRRTQKSGGMRIPGASDDFHVYGVEWLPDQLIFTIDDAQVFIYRPEQYASNPTWREWPFDKRMHILINVAFGGDWGGARGVDDNCLPQRMLIDYVRVYQSAQINQLAEGQ